MERHITAVIINGPHQGKKIQMNYRPEIVLAELPTPSFCPKFSFEDEPTGVVEQNYRACFYSVDRQIVLYSISGCSSEVLPLFEEMHLSFNH